MEFESRYKLYQFLGLLSNPTKHNLNLSNWIMVEFMFAQFEAIIVCEMSATNFVVILLMRIVPLVMVVGSQSKHTWLRTRLDCYLLFS